MVSTQTEGCGARCHLLMIVTLEGATVRVRDGQVITVDGSTGVVTIG